MGYWQDDNSFGSVQADLYDSYLNDLNLTEGIHSINSLEYDPITDSTYYSFTTHGTGDMDGMLDDFSIGAMDGDPLGLSTSHMGGMFDSQDYYDPGFDNYMQDMQEGQMFIDMNNLDVVGEIKSRIDNVMNANAKTVVFLTDGKYSGSIIGGHHFPANAYPGLGGIKVGDGTLLNGYMPHIPLRKDRPPMAEKPQPYTFTFPGAEPFTLQPTQAQLHHFAEMRFKAELGQYFFGNSTPQEANFFIQQYARSYAPTLGISEEDALTWVGEMLEDNQLRDLPFTYNKNEDGSYVFQTTTVNNPEDLNFYNVNDTSVKQAGAYREFAIAAGADVYSEIPSPNVPDKFSVAIGDRIYRTAEQDEFGNYNYFIDKVENDPRLNKAELLNIQSKNGEIQIAPSFVTEAERQASMLKAKDAALLKPEDKDSFVNNVLAGAAAMTGDPVGKIDGDTLTKALFDTASNTANTALGLLNILSFVQDGLEAVGEFLTGKEDIMLGGDIPNKTDVLEFIGDKLGLDLLNDVDIKKAEQQQQASLRKNYTRLYKDGKLTDDAYASLEFNYQKFLAGKGGGNNMPYIEGLVYGTNDINSLLNYEIDLQTPMQRSQSYLKMIEEAYIRGEVSDFQLLDAYNKHKDFIGSMGNQGVGVTQGDVEFVTGKPATYIPEAPMSYDINHEIDYDVKLPPANNAEEQLIFNEAQASADSKVYNNTQPQLENYYNTVPDSPIVDPSLYTNTDGTIDTQAYVNALGVTLNNLKEVGDTSYNDAMTQIAQNLSGTISVPTQQEATPLLDAIESELLKHTTVTQEELDAGNLTNLQIKPGSERLNIDEVMENLAKATDSNVIKINDYMTYDKTTNTITDVLSESFTPIKQYSDQQLYIDEMGRLRDENTQEVVDPVANYTPEQKLEYDGFIEQGFSEAQAMLEVAGQVNIETQDTFQQQQAEYEQMRELIGTSDYNLTLSIENIVPEKLPTQFLFADIEVPALPTNPNWVKTEFNAITYADSRKDDENFNYTDPSQGDWVYTSGPSIINFYNQQQNELQNYVKNELLELDLSYASTPDQAGLALMNKITQLAQEGIVGEQTPVFRTSVFDDDRVEKVSFNTISGLIISMAITGESDFGGFVPTDGTQLEQGIAAAKLNNIIFDNLNRLNIEQYDNDKYYLDRAKGTQTIGQWDSHLTKEQIQDLLLKQGKGFTFYNDRVVQGTDGEIYEYSDWESYPLTVEYTGYQEANGTIGTVKWGDHNQGDVVDGKSTFNTTQVYNLERPEDFKHPLLSVMEENIGVRTMTVDLINQITDLDKKTIELQGKINDAETSRNELAQLAEERGLTINALIAQLETINGEISSNDQQAQELANKLAEAEAEVQSKQQEIDNLDTQIAQIQSELDAESMRADTNQILIDSNTRLLQQQVEIKVQLQVDLELANREIENMREEGRSFDAIANGLIQDKKDLQENLDAEKEANAELNTQLTKAGEELELVKGELSTTQVELEAAKAEKVAKQAELDGVNQTLDNLEQLYNGKITELEFKEKQLETITTQKEAIEAALQAESGKLAISKADLTNAQNLLAQKEQEHAAAVAKLEEEKAAAVAKGEADVEATTTRLNEEKVDEIRQLRAEFANDLAAKLTELNVQLSSEKATALEQAEAAHETALQSALAAAGTEAEEEKLAALKEQGETLAAAQQAALDEQKAILDAEAQNALTLALQSQKLEIEGLAAEQLANTQKDYDAQIASLNEQFEQDRAALQASIDTYKTNETLLNNNITQLDNDLKTANENLTNKTQQYNAQVEINTFKQGLIDDLEDQLGVISAENLAYIDEIAQLKVTHQGEKDAAFDEYQTNLITQEQSLTATYTQQLQDLKKQLEDQSAADIAAKEAELQAEKESELQAQAQAAQTKLEEELAAARADEQLIASGNLAAREAELQSQYESELQAAQQKADSDLQAAVAAETTRQEGILAQQIADLQTSLNAQHAQAKADLKIQLQTEYQSALDAQAVSHNDQIAQLNASHEETVAALRSQLEGEKALAVKAVEEESARQIASITEQHALDIQAVETEAQNRYDKKLEEELAKANADFEAASAAAQAEADSYLNSERERLEGEKDAKVAEVTASYEATIAENEENYNTQIGSLQSENDALRLTIEELTPPPPMYLGIDGEDYRVIDEEERAYLDNLKEEGLSGLAHNVLNLPTLYNYEGNVVYNPEGFNNEDLWSSDQIQKLYYEGFPQTEAELVDLIKRNPDIFGEVNEDGSNREIATDFIQKVKDGIMDVGYALQQLSGGSVNTGLLNIMGFFFAGGVPLGNILNAAGDIFGPDTAIELAKTLQRQINNRRNFSDNKIVEWDEVMRIHLDESDIGTYDPADFTDPNHPSNEDIINMAEGTTGRGPGGTSVTGNVAYSDVNLGDPTDYLYQILRIIEGPEVAERFKGKGMSDPEGFELISKYLDQTTLDAAIRANAVDEVALFGTDDQRGSIEIQGEAAQKIQDIAQALRDDQALSDIELINKYGAEAAEAIKGLDPDRLEQQSLLQDLAKKRLQEAIDFDPEVLPQEKLIGEAATSLLEDVRSESLIEKAVKEAALGQLDVNLTEGEALVKAQALDYLKNAGKLSQMEIQEIEDNISTGLRARGRLDSDFGLMQEIVGRTQAELDREDKDIALGLGLYGEFDQLYGGRLARGATLGTAGESLTAARRADNRANIAAGTELVGQLYNFENNRIQQQNANDTMAANLQKEYDRQSAAVTGDVFGMLLGSLSASPYGTTALSTVGGNVQAPTNLTNLTSMASQDYANAQTFGSTMEGLSALQSGSRDYMNFLTQGMQGYSQASSSGVNPYTPSFSNMFEGYGDLNFGQKVGVISSSVDQVQDFFGGGGFTGDKNTTIIDTFKGGLTGDPNTNVFDFFKGGFTGDPNTSIFDFGD